MCRMAAYARYPENIMGKFKFPSVYHPVYSSLRSSPLRLDCPCRNTRWRHECHPGKRSAGLPVPMPQTEAHPQGLTAVLLAPIDGLYNHETYTAGAIDVWRCLSWIIGGFLGVVKQNGRHRRRHRTRTVRLNGKEEG